MLPEERCSQLLQARGQSVIELCAAAPLLVIMILLFLDLLAIIIGASTNHSIVVNASRAAAIQSSIKSAEAAASIIVEGTGESTFIRSISLTRFSYNDSPARLVRVETTVVIGLPCPLAGWSEVRITEEAVQSILTE